ncbi:MAG TPA: hypothetical protein VJS44_09820 [Pyrinomonadaceae bacterium]|nr:hypothetical protein [Pyrinomonadaceae bacterium]
MRKLKHLYMTAVLTLALSITAFGGDMQTPSVSSPPPPPQVTVIDCPIDETSNNDVANKESVTEIALYLFDSMVYMLF